jgi:uncharacterized coiled-coil DUF342 family protein
VLLHSTSQHHYFLSQAEKDCEALRAKVNRVAAQVQQAEAAAGEQRAQTRVLQNAIAEAEQVSCRFKAWIGLASA